ncbi:WD domain-containing protein [Microdochium trichocladiopsis]|uniref:WD domain-containing protein n=1 Tax=Microdochium trichocladiopsis TaxID=1682393 RepID=A0A9P8XUY2_9PEZI|nr:WD domain-containing protein [Microdochium trichocladiopsis]KAH7018371.1 WD domain-containing protein [Microdochium trichocladiopsis]
MYPLSCVDGHKQTGRDGDIYITNLIPLDAGLVTTSSDQILSMYNPSTIGAGPIRTFRTHHGNITCARVFDGSISTLCTAGEDGSVSIWDLRQNQPEVATLKDNSTSILSLACSSTGHTIAAGTELENHQASILLWDVRSTPRAKHSYKEVHSDDVCELNFHPVNANVLLSGSTDGLVNICDTNVVDEDEVVVQTCNLDASIHHAAFLNDTELYALSHDERFALFNVAEGHETGKATTDYGDMRNVLGCQYIANVTVKANGAGAVIGAGSHDEEIFELVHLTKVGDGWSVDKDNSVGLPGAHSSEIVRAFCFDDAAQVVYSVGEDGYIKAWRPT